MTSAIRVDAARPPDPSREPLTPFEGHCLCRRTCECEELLQLAVLGAERAHQQHSEDAALSEIVSHLNEAERHVEIARQLASRWR